MNLLTQLLSPQKTFSHRSSRRPTLSTLAQVKRDTHITIIENDIPQFSGVKPYHDWPHMVEKWLQTEASVDLYCQSIHPIVLSNHSALTNLQHYPHFTLYQIDSNRAHPHITRLLKDLETFHFTLFENPNQVWLESYHAPGNSAMQDCEFVPSKHYEKDPRMQEYKSVVEEIKPFARRVNILDKIVTQV